MKYIKISDLKKEAKQERKNNKDIKNHSESLNLIANKYNKDKWEDLLDSSVLIIKKDNNHLIDVFEKIIEHSIIEIEDIQDVFNSNDESAITDYILSKCHSEKLEYTIFEEKTTSAVNFLFYIVSKEKNKTIIEKMELFEKLLDLDFLIKHIQNGISSKKIIEDKMTKNFCKNVLCVHKGSISDPNIINFTSVEQFSFVITELTIKIPLFIKVMKVFNNPNTIDILNKIREKENAVIFFSKEFLVNKKLLQNYQEFLIGKRTTLYSSRFLTKHFELVDNYLK
jgi:hypothetical protein